MSPAGLIVDPRAIRSLMRMVDFVTSPLLDRKDFWARAVLGAAAVSQPRRLTGRSGAASGGSPPHSRARPGPCRFVHDLSLATALRSEQEPSRQTASDAESHCRCW